jgi:large subunit ribosomal protein L15
VSAAFEGGQMPIHMRLPKLKGFRNRFRVEFQVVNLERLVELFPQGGQVGPAELVDSGAVRKNQLIKILGGGDLGGVTFQLTANAFSSSAKEKIEAAGGTVTEV